MSDIVMVVETANGNRYAPDVTKEEFTLEQVQEDSTLNRWYEFMLKHDMTYHMSNNVLYRLYDGN